MNPPTEWLLPGDPYTQELQELTAAIEQREALVAEVKKRSGRDLTQSDLGWLLSIFASETGTLLAVMRGIHARKWDDIARRLEEEILWLKLDRKFKEEELKRQASAI